MDWSLKRPVRGARTPFTNPSTFLISHTTPHHPQAPPQPSRPKPQPPTLAPQASSLTPQAPPPHPRVPYLRMGRAHTNLTRWRWTRRSSRPPSLILRQHPIDQWRRGQPFVTWALAFMVGIACGMWLPWTGAWLTVATPLLAVTFVWLIRGRRCAAMCWGMLALVALAAGWSAQSIHHVAPDHVGAIWATSRNSRRSPAPSSASLMKQAPIAGRSASSVMPTPPRCLSCPSIRSCATPSPFMPRANC